MNAARSASGGKAAALAWVALAYLVAAAAAAVVGWALRGQHPLLRVGLADLAATVVVFVFSVVFDNSSFYDPYWSVAPIPIALYFGLGVPGADPHPVRLWLIVGLVSAWGLRLTYNWARGWSGLDHEDWRYRDLRASSGRAYWLVSFLGIQLLPTALVFGGCLPIYAALCGPGAASAPGLLDLGAAVITAAAVLIEAVADQQLRRHVLSRPDRGAILQRGLWGWSRHPNYFGELLLWWGLSLFALAASASSWWTLAGPVAMTVLFLFVSLPMIERRMARRRPEAHADVRRRISLLVPLPPRRG